MKPWRRAKWWRTFPASRSALRVPAFVFLVFLAAVSQSGADSPGAVLWQDDFNDGDDAGWTPIEGAWSVADSAYRGSFSGDGRSLAGDTAWTDYSYEGRFLFDPSSAYEATILVRVNDARPGTNLGHYYQIANYVTLDQVRLHRINDGLVEIVSAPWVFEPGTWYTFKVEVRGSSIRYFLNDALVLAYENAQIYPSGRIGVKAYSSTAWFDDLVVRSFPVPDVNRFVLVTGFQSGNVVRFDLSTGAAEEVVVLEPEGAPGTGDRPRGVAVDRDNRIYVALRGGTQNVKRFSWGGAYIDDFTESIGGTGPGQIGFSRSGDLIVGGDVSGNHSVYRYDGTTGGLIDSFRLDGFQNVVGLLVDGDFVYSGSYYNGAIARYDLSVTPVAGIAFIAANALTERVLGMTIGHTGNLLIASTANGAVQEFDIVTGEFIRTFLPFGVVDIHYDAYGERYYVTGSGNSATELDQDGNVTRVFQSSDLQGAYSVTVPAIADLPVLPFPDSERVRLDWPSQECASTYEISRALAGGTPTPIDTVVTPFLIDSGLADETDYVYRVRGLSGGGSTCALSSRITTRPETWAFVRSDANPSILGNPGYWDARGAGHASVIETQGIFEAWYSDSAAIGYAIKLAPDAEWIKNTQPVLSPASGTWDEDAVREPSVGRIGDTYHMWYTGRANGASRIGHATSIEGTLWDRDVANPALSPGSAGTFDSQGLRDPEFVDANGVWYLYYTADDDTTSRIARARSTDGGATWQKEGVTLDIGTGMAWDESGVSGAAVLFDGAWWRMWYTGWNTAGQRRIGYAISPDGLTWQRRYTNPILTASEPWEAGDVFAPDVQQGHGVYRLWYTAGGPNEAIGYVDNVIGSLATDVEAGSGVASTPALRILDTRPNPFNPAVTLRFVAADARDVELCVIAIDGRRVLCQELHAIPSGEHVWTWDGRDAFGKAMSSGVYLFSIESGSQRVTAKAVLLR